MNASSDRLLRRTLWGNAVLSMLSGVGLAAFATPLAAMATHAPVTVLGLDLAIVFELLGIGFAVFGAVCAWVAAQSRLPVAWARTIFLLDASWVVITLAVLALPVSWTVAGYVGIVGIGLVVADLAILEYLGLRRLGTAN
ncbi:MAG: hypothetical protein LCH93_19945 [Proteobacteria bacterium]|nr:hypothetical protein [Pseudomonadota bacterium]